MWKLGELADRLGGILRGDPDRFVSGFATDSRDVRSGDLFLAIRGAQVDGHAYVESAMASGAVAAVVERPTATPHIQVTNLVAALAMMARSYRMEYQGHVIGVTGSAGKSSTKELLAAALNGNVAKTEGNRNTEYTAPLLWPFVLCASPTPDSVVVEMGMRGFGQIAHLCSFSKPTIGVITNIGVAHISELGSRENIARAKAELFEALPDDGTAIYWAEDDFASYLKDVAGTRKVRTFGFSEAADTQVVAYRASGWDASEIDLRLGGHTFRAAIPVVGRHFALNAAAAFLAATEAGTPPADAAAGLSRALLPPMRMAVRIWGEQTFLLDMYNASPPAVLGALETVRDVLAGETADHQKQFVAVLGEMRELGTLAEEGHRQVGAALAQYGVDEAVLLAANPSAPTPFIGSLREAAIQAGMDAAKIRIASSHEAVKVFLDKLKGPAVVLVKGSRAVELERALPEGVL